MSKIRSIADELREKIRAESGSPPAPDPPEIPEKSAEVSQGKPGSDKTDQEEIHRLFDELSAFRMEGTQKIMIRLDPESMKLLKQLKFTRDIDMTKVIVFAFSKFLQQHPWLHSHVKELLKKTSYDLD